MKETIISVLLVVLAVCLLTACAARAPADDLTATQNETEVAKDITPADDTAVEDSEMTDKVDTEPTTVPNEQTVTEQKKAETTTAKGVVKPGTTKHTTAPAATKRAETTTKKRVEATTAKRVETTTAKKPAVATTQKHTEPTTAKKPTPTTKAPTTQKPKPTTTIHQHTYKAVYREEPVYEEQPRYKCVQHTYCSVCGLDFTELARKNGTSTGQISADHLTIHPHHHGVGKLVEEPIGYEKVQVGTKKVIDHYECTGCGATKK